MVPRVKETTPYIRCVRVPIITVNMVVMVDMSALPNIKAVFEDVTLLKVKRFTTIIVILRVNRVIFGVT